MGEADAAAPAVPAPAQIAPSAAPPRPGGPRRLALSLQQRLYLLVFLAVLPALGIQAHGAWEAFRLQAAQTRDEGLRLAEFVSGELWQLIDSNRALLVALSRLPVVQDRDGPGCRAYVAELAGRFPGYVGFSVVDDAGRLWCTSPPQPTRAVNLGDRPYFTQARDAGAFTVGTVVTTRIDGRQVLPLAFPLRTAEDRFAGAVVSGIDLAWLNAYFAGKPIPEGGSISVVDAAGTVLVRVPEIAGVVGSGIRSDLRPFLVADRAGTGETVNLLGRRVIYAYLPPAVTPHGLYVGISLDRDRAMADVRAGAIRSGLLLLLSLALALAAAMIGGRLFVRRPLATLAETADRWRAGDLTARAGLRETSTEIGRVGAALDGMAAALQAHERELEDAIASRDASLLRQQVLADELQHRVKNTLATIQALARQTLRGEDVAPAKREAFEKRLLALAAVHDALTREDWVGAGLAEVLARVTAPHGGTEAGDRIRSAGPTLRLGPDQALALAMVLHELCTNAVKYGALAESGGSVTVTWGVEAERLRLEWREAGGPPASAPGRVGFGSRLVELMVTQKLRGTVRRDWRPEGLCCAVELPLGGPGAA